MRLARWGVFAAALAAAVTVSSCSSGGGDAHDGPFSSGGGLAAAMDSVSASGPAAKSFSYGDFARLRDLGVISGAAGDQHVDTRWGAVAGLGADQLASVAKLLPDPTGIDVFGYDTAVTIGQPPNTATKLTGTVPADTIRSKLTALGATERTFGDTKGLSLAGDNKIDVSKQIAPGVLNQLNQIVVTDEVVAMSPNGASLQAVLDGGEASLLDTGHYRDVADCLGDVVAAMILAPKRTTSADVVAVGIRATSNGDAPPTVTEVLCALPADGKQSAVLAAMKAAFAPDATDPATREPMSHFVSDADVAAEGPVVRAVLTPAAQRPVGFLVQGLMRGLVAHWVGA